MNINEINFFFFLRYTLNRSILIKLDEESYFNEWNHCTFSCFILIVINTNGRERERERNNELRLFNYYVFID